MAELAFSLDRHLLGFHNSLAWQKVSQVFGEMIFSVGEKNLETHSSLRSLILILAVEGSGFCTLGFSDSGGFGRWGFWTFLGFGRWGF